MASLAFMVLIIFLFSLIIGPFCFLLSRFKIIPTWIVYIFSILSILIGLWWLCLPVPFGTKIISIWNIGFGIFSIHKRNNWLKN